MAHEEVDHEERIKADDKLKIANKRQTKRTLDAFKNTIVKSKPIKTENFACANRLCTSSTQYVNNTARAISPPGLWLCRNCYFQRVQEQLNNPNGRLFLQDNDLNVYAAAVEILGAFGTVLPDDQEPINPTMPIVYVGRIYSDEQGEIWYGSYDPSKLNSLERKIGSKVNAA